MTQPPSPPATPLEALAIVAICFGWFILNSVMAVALGFPSGGGEFNDASFLDLIATECLLGAVALAVLHARGYPVVRLLPAPSWRGCVAGLLVFALTTIAWWIVALAFTSGEYAQQPIVQMVAAARLSPAMVVALSMVNGLYEETFLLGYLVDAFRESGAALAIGVSLLVRVLYHLYQGPMGAVSALTFGLVLSLVYWRTGKLWPVAFAHTLADAAAFM